MGHAVGINAGLKPPPSLLERVTTPRPRGVIKRLPMNITFLVNIERSDPMHLVSSRDVNQKHARDTYLQIRTRLSALLQRALPSFPILTWSVSDLESCVDITLCKELGQ